VWQRVKHDRQGSGRRERDGRQNVSEPNGQVNDLRSLGPVIRRMVGVEASQSQENRGRLDCLANPDDSMLGQMDL